MDQLRDVVAKVLLPASKAQHTGQDLWLQWDVLGNNRPLSLQSRQQSIVTGPYIKYACNTHSTRATSLRGKNGGKYPAVSLKELYTGRSINQFALNRH